LTSICKCVSDIQIFPEKRELCLQKSLSTSSGIFRAYVKFFRFISHIDPYLFIHTVSNSPTLFNRSMKTNGNLRVRSDSYKSCQWRIARCVLKSLS